MNERNLLLAAIWAAPKEDTPRLMYADWLQEHGDEPRAEFIRVQVELARMAKSDPGRVSLAHRENELLTAHLTGWKKEVAVVATGAEWIYRRGFPDTLNLHHASITVSLWKELAKLTNLNSLDLGVTRLTDVGMKELAKLTNLTSLNLGYTRVTDAGMTELAKLTNLNSLDLGLTEVTDVGMKELAKLTNLNSLNGKRRNPSAF